MGVFDNVRFVSPMETAIFQFLADARALVNGLRVERIIVDDALFSDIQRLANIQDNSPIRWQEILLVPSNKSDKYRTAYTLDLSSFPFLYRNQSGYDMEIQPPWEPVSVRRTSSPAALTKKGSRRIILRKTKQED